MARSKDRPIPLRVNADLGDSFEDALAKHGGFTSRTAFFEDCMRALIVAVREGKRLEVPLGFLERGKPKR